MSFCVNEGEDYLATINVELRNAADEVLAIKTIPDVVVRRNCQTILTGAMFTNSNAKSGFDIIVKDAWGNSIETNF